MQRISQLHRSRLAALLACTFLAACTAAPSQPTATSAPAPAATAASSAPAAAATSAPAKPAAAAPTPAPASAAAGSQAGDTGPIKIGLLLTNVGASGIFARYE